MEVFARAEVAVDECLLTLEAAGIPPDAEARHPGARMRARSLRNTLDGADPGPHAKAAIRTLDAWMDLQDDRTWIAHGVFRVRRDGLRIEWRDPTGRRADCPPLYLTRFDMLERLQTFDRHADQLRQMLGRVRRALRDLQPRQDL